MTKEIVMKMRRFGGMIFFASMLLWGAECYGQTLTRITEGNYSELGLEDNRLVGCWLLDSSMINDDMVASESLSQYDTHAIPEWGYLHSENFYSWDNPFYKHTYANFKNRVYPRLVIADVDGTPYNDDYRDWGNAVVSFLYDYANYKGYSTWRLPTQRELMLIYIATQLTKGETPTFQDGQYWTATSDSRNGYENNYLYYSDGVWVVNFSDGRVETRARDYSSYYDPTYFRPVLEL